jgi:hypothetical protein
LSTAGKEFDDKIIHSRDVRSMSALLLSGLACAGVFARIDSESGIIRDPPANGAVGF